MCMQNSQPHLFIYSPHTSLENPSSLQVKDIMLIDVTPLTLGVETEGGVFSEVLPRGSAVPWQAREGMPMGPMGRFVGFTSKMHQNARDRAGELGSSDLMS